MACELESSKWLFGTTAPSSDHQRKSGTRPQPPSQQCEADLEQRRARLLVNGDSALLQGRGALPDPGDENELYPLRVTAVVGLGQAQQAVENLVVFHLENRTMLSANRQIQECALPIGHSKDQRLVDNRVGRDTTTGCTGSCCLPPTDHRASRPGSLLVARKCSPEGSLPLPG